jgi:hypothetical protein
MEVVTMNKKQAMKFKGMSILNVSDNICSELDALIKKGALQVLKREMKKQEIPKIFKNFIILFAETYYDSGEVDELLTKLNCYDQDLLNLF